jgi:hypothetical protein
MRITRDALLKLMRDAVTRRTRADRNVIAAYLCGSLLEEDYMLGGVADIDLVFIHSDVITVEREIQSITDEVHLDIGHYFHRDFRQTRQLRVHPWLGPTLKNCLILYDPQHFLDFTQASVRGQFDRSDHVLDRVRQQVDTARQIWSTFHTSIAEIRPQEVQAYLKAVQHAASAVASLGGKLLTERRFLSLYHQWVNAIGKPGLYAGLLGLLGKPNVDAATLISWLPFWESAYRAVPSAQAPARLHPLREYYYRRAFETMLDSSQPQDVLWSLLNTWTLAVNQLPVDHPARREWQTAFEHLGLLAHGFQERMQALDAYLDMVEETVEKWARDNGAEYQN